MDEAEFWPSLEFRLCREFAGMRERDLRSLWCDGFIPEQYFMDDPVPRITGRAWICNGPKQHEWEFVLLLPHSATSKEKIDWASLLPPEDVTQWLSVDQSRKRIEIDPSVAIPDAAAL